ncbi:MAG: GldG family protein [Gammaproteobacteria bacterium]|nr:GldG family protein [Gammaproteobacteria bacterium]
MAANNFTRKLRYHLVAILIVSGMIMTAWLSNLVFWPMDWSMQKANTLSTASQSLLMKLEHPVKVTAYVAENRELHQQIRDQVQLYTNHKSDLTLHFVDPKKDPQQVRQLDIHPAGEIVVEYDGRLEKLRTVDEKNLSNALLRLTSPHNKWLVFLDGHGERSPHKPGNQDLALFANYLKQSGLQVQSLNLSVNPVIPDNTGILVIASPKFDLSLNETGLILDYLDKGRNLLWLVEPGTESKATIELEALRNYLGVRFLPGTIISASTPKLGIKNPAMVIVQQYSGHSILNNLRQGTLFPFTMALKADQQAAAQENRWDIENLLETDRQSWTETGILTTPPLQFNQNTDEVAGPLTIGLSLTRTAPSSDIEKQQRIVVIGDGDFLSNAYLANGGNQFLGNSIIHWLGNQDSFIQIQPINRPDLDLVLSDSMIMLYTFVFPFALPVIFFAAGFIIRRYRARA